MYHAVKRARTSDKKVIWVDEAVFTFNTFSQRAWSSKYSSIKVKDTDAKIKTMALIAGISEDCGLEWYLIHPKAISTPEFVTFINEVSEKLGGREFCLFMDNLQVHKTKEVIECCAEKKV